jgi:uncharacterized cupredoxin-like copper-binding protein
LLALALAACGSGESTPPEADLSLTATDIAYDTLRLEAQVGQKVTVTLNNEGALVHDFSIMEMPHTGEVVAGHTDEETAGHDMGDTEDPEVHVASPAGGSNTVEFTPAEAGEYEYFCTVPGHREAGMSGTLVVTAP